MGIRTMSLPPSTSHGSVSHIRVTHFRIAHYITLIESHLEIQFMEAVFPPMDNLKRLSLGVLTSFTVVSELLLSCALAIVLSFGM